MIKKFFSKLKRLTVGYLSTKLRPLAARRPWLTSFYYCFLSQEFRREQQAFLSGVECYDQSQENPDSLFSMLRRNIHRLEKGLLMRPRRNIFAEQYITDTVNCYVKVVESNRGSVDVGLMWSRDVLTEYFRVVGSHPILNSAREVFESAPKLPPPNAKRKIPYHRDPSDIGEVTIDELEHLSLRRRSVRWFLDKPVEREKIDRAIEVAAQAPSACNRQPFVFRVLDDPERVRQVAQLPMGTGGYRQNIPVLIIIVGQQRNYFHERDRHLIYIDGSLAAMSFLFAAEVQGLGTCCINWADVEHLERKMAAELELETDERPIMCLAVGYPDPDGMVAYSQKKTLDQLRKYN